MQGTADNLRALGGSDEPQMILSRQFYKMTRYFETHPVIPYV